MCIVHSFIIQFDEEKKKLQQFNRSICFINFIPLVSTFVHSAVDFFANPKNKSPHLMPIPTHYSNYEYASGEMNIIQSVY